MHTNIPNIIIYIILVLLTSPVFTERTLAWEDKRQYMHALTSITIISKVMLIFPLIIVFFIITHL